VAATPARCATSAPSSSGSSARKASTAEQQRDFDTLWNGVTVRADVAAAQDMQSLRSVTAVYPVAVIEQPEPTEVSPELVTAITMTGADAAQSELGLTGEGISVAIIDTGIDYNHVDLGGDGDHANRIQAAADRTSTTRGSATAGTTSATSSTPPTRTRRRRQPRTPTRSTSRVTARTSPASSARTRKAARTASPVSLPA
jgi:subtilisin family serine protease